MIGAKDGFGTMCKKPTAEVAKSKNQGQFRVIKEKTRMWGLDVNLWYVAEQAGRFIRHVEGIIVVARAPWFRYICKAKPLETVLRKIAGNNVSADRDVRLLI